MVDTSNFGWPDTTCYPSSFYSDPYENDPAVPSTARVPCPGRVKIFDLNSDAEITPVDSNGNTNSVPLRTGRILMGAENPYQNTSFAAINEICVDGCKCYKTRVTNETGATTLSLDKNYAQRAEVIEPAGKKYSVDDDSGTQVLLVDGSACMLDSSCEKILEGEFCLTDTCTRCGMGFYLNHSSTTGFSCEQCPPGKYLTAYDHHEQSCLDCGVGKYNSQSGSSSQDDCLSCENGKYSDYTTATQESDCRTCDISTPNITPDQGECYAIVGVSDLAGLKVALDQVTMGCCAAVGSHVTLQDGTYSKVHVVFPNTAPGWHGEVRGSDENMNAVLDGELDGNGAIFTIGPTNGATVTLKWLQFYQSSGATYAGLRIGGGCTAASPCSVASNVQVIQCEFRSNIQYGAEYGYGGAISVRSRSWPSTEDILTMYGVFFDNNKRFSSQGNDIYLEGSLTVSSSCSTGERAKFGKSLSIQLGIEPGGEVSGSQYSMNGCESCPAGSYNDVQNSPTCTLCPAGKYQDESAASSCKDCGVGRYNEADGANDYSLCVQCEPGKYSNDPTSDSQYNCLLCDAGKYASNSGSSECHDCPRGEYSAMFSAFCLYCPPGTFSNVTAAESCSDCTPGTYSTTGGLECELCPTGSYSNSDGNVICVDCTAGKQSTGDRTYCTDCEAGKYSNLGDPACTTCEVGKYSEGEGNTICLSCGAPPTVLDSTTRAAGATNRDDCVCEPGYYAHAQNMICAEIGTLSMGDDEPVNSSAWAQTIETLDLSQGFWRVSTTATFIYPCPVKEVCVGGLTIDDNNGSTCAAGHFGPFCQVCMPDYAMSSGECILCEGSEKLTVILGMIGFLLAFAVAVFACYRFQKIASKHHNEHDLIDELQEKVTKMKTLVLRLKVKGKIILSYLQIATGLAFNFNMTFPLNFTRLMNAFSIVNLDFGGYMPMACLIPLNYIDNLYISTSFSLGVSAILFFGSRIAYRRSNGNAKGDAYVVPELGSPQLTKPGTPKPVKADWSSLLFNNLLLFTFLILPSISTKIIYTFACLELTDDDGEINTNEDGDIINLNEGYFLKADYSIRCYGGSHNVASAYAIFMVCIFPLGIPLWYFFLLYHQRHLLDPGQASLMNTMNVKIPTDEKNIFEYLWPERDEAAEEKEKLSPKGEKHPVIFKSIPHDRLVEAVEKRNGIILCLDEDEACSCALWMRGELEKSNPNLARLKFLYDSYECQCWWFEVFETWRKLMLTSGLIFFDAGTSSQIVVSIMICLFSMRIYSGYKPFILPNDDRLAETSQWQLFFTLFGALMLKVEVGNEDSTSQAAFEELVTVIQFVIPVLLLYQTLLERHKRAVGEEEEEEEDGVGGELHAWFGSMTEKIGLDELVENVNGAMGDVVENVNGAVGEALGSVVGQAGDTVKGKVEQKVEELKEYLKETEERCVDGGKETVASTRNKFLATWKGCVEEGADLMVFFEKTGLLGLEGQERPERATALEALKLAIEKEALVFVEATLKKSNQYDLGGKLFEEVVDKFKLKIKSALVGDVDRAADFVADRIFEGELELKVEDVE
ncbi:hypothetical protein TrST_g2374 [Triparma strigata]|uniref:Tyrosine-protein kinase ephrin type A/B receptor-like domain-containing protein n=1 Tax=Triparma strigata TaxID=1606541 RepID=A0A9W7ANC1_9STRA|nr:hypothetical protein TrST_g2374 [Triparma strigata]